MWTSGCPCVNYTKITITSDQSKSWLLAKVKVVYVLSRMTTRDFGTQEQQTMLDHIMTYMLTAISSKQSKKP